MPELKICIIGNSHTASFRTGWAKIHTKYPNVTISYFVGRGQYFDDLYADEESRRLLLNPDGAQKVYINSSEIEHELNFDAFDLCLIIGTPNWRLNTNRKRFSSQVVEAATLGFFENSHAYRLLKEIRKLSAIEVKIVHKPFPAGECGSRPSNTGNYLQEVELINKKLLGLDKAKLLAQPRSTYDKNLQTKWEFAVGLRTEKLVHNALGPYRLIDDITHMNASYGKIFWDEVLG